MTHDSRSAIERLSDCDTPSYLATRGTLSAWVVRLWGHTSALETLEALNNHEGSIAPMLSTLQGFLLGSDVACMHRHDMTDAAEELHLLYEVAEYRFGSGKTA